MLRLRKFHKISTLIAIISGSLGAVIYFLFTVDRFLKLDIFQNWAEPVVGLIAALTAILFMTGTILSAVISLYLLSEK